MLTVTVRVSAGGGEVLRSRAVVLPPQGVTDPDTGNNQAVLLVLTEVVPSKRWLLASSHV